jgi:hypothetical protein
VNDERRPAAWTGKISPNVDMAAADLSLNMPTCPSVNIDPNFKVLSPNLLPTWSLLEKNVIIMLASQTTTLTYVCPPKTKSRKCHNKGGKSMPSLKFYIILLARIQSIFTHYNQIKKISNGVIIIDNFICGTTSINYIAYDCLLN